MTIKSPKESSVSGDPVRVEHLYGGETPPSIAIIRAIAVIENVDPLDVPSDFEFILHDYVDPESLDQLAVANSTETNVKIELTIQTDPQYAIQIHGDGHLIVEKAGETSENQSRDDSVVPSVPSDWILSRLRTLAGNIYD